MRSLKLYFQSQELIAVTFRESEQCELRQTVRGKTSGAMRGSGSFQWTSAVKALSLLLSKAALGPESSIISGSAGSLAASLDYALAKQPMWICEMFGCDAQGISLARRFILRTNSERKRPGPVVLGINHVALPFGSIEVYANGFPASPSQLAQIVSRLSDRPNEGPLAPGALEEAQESRLASNQ